MVRGLAVGWLFPLILAAGAPAFPDQSESGPGSGPLQLPPLPPLKPDSPLSSMVYADRKPVGSVYEGTSPGEPTLIQETIPAKDISTGKKEIFWYQLPANYDPNGLAAPLVVAYHGFGSSPASVHAQSTIDEECNERGWLYMAPTGIDDKLFGSPVSQINVEAAIQWMLDNTNADPDRIYMIGFSMGAGVAANFAARHRDPDGIMIAGVGTVAGSFDWIQSYELDTAGGIQVWLEDEYNFGGNPCDPGIDFNYQQSSALYLLKGTYPPLPGVVSPDLSMATNLHATPVYMTWDNLDTIVELPFQNVVLSVMLNNNGVDLAAKIVTGTVDPETGESATHSWAVLDEDDAFNFFSGKTVDRRPEEIRAQVDVDRQVSFIDATMRTPGQFAYVDAISLPTQDRVEITTAENLVSSTVRADDAGQPGVEPRVLAVSTDADGFTLRLADFDNSPSYLLDPTTSTLIPGADFDVEDAALMIDVPALGALDAQIVAEPNWTATLSVTPDPAPLGELVSLEIDATPGPVLGTLIVGTQELLITIQGSAVVVPPLLPALIIPLPLDENGDVTIDLTLPNDPLLSGLSVPMQLVVGGIFGAISEVSNLQVFVVE